jgi:hypothetical protein
MSAGSAGGAGRSARVVVLPIALVLLLVGVAYSGALRAGYVLDDRQFIVENPLVKELAPVGAYFAPFRRGEPPGPAGAYYRPLTALSHGLERHFFGSDPFGPHLVNLILHLLCVVLVFALALRGGAGPWTSSAAAALFGLFPRSTEAVTWISARSTLLSTACVLAALLLHRSEAKRWGSRLAAAALLGVGFLCKEFAAVGVGALVVLELVRWKRSGEPLARALANLAPALAVMLVYAVWRPPLVQPAVDFGLPVRLISSVEALGYDAWMLLTPFGAKLFLGMQGLVQPRYVAAGAVVAIGGAFGAWALLRRLPPPLETAAYSLAAGAVLVTLPILPIGDISVTADRFLYPVIAGLAIGLALRSRGLPARWTRHAAAVATGLVLLFAVGTYRRNVLWQDELALATDTLARTSPDLRDYAFPVHFWLSRIHRCAARWKEATEEQEAGVRAEQFFEYRYPNFPQADVQLQILGLLKQNRVKPGPICWYR